MAVKMRFDTSNNIIRPTFALATRNGSILGFLPASNIHIADNFNSHFEIGFDVNKYDNGEECPLWSQIKDFKLVYCPEWNVWFEIYVEVEEENSIVKNISGVSVCEAELSQISLFGIEINTETDISRDDYKVTTLFNEEDSEASMLNRLIEKIPHYTIKHVDSSIAKVQRVFSFDDVTIYDAFQEIAEEIDCIFIFDSGMDEDGKIARGISVYDLESYCVDCEKRGDFTDVCPHCGGTNIVSGYGEDTNIFVSTDNLADGITYSTDTDAVKNCFRLEAGDDLMTATLVNCNPNGSGYIWNISDETKADMSPELASKITQYDALYESYQTTASLTLDSGLVADYNELVDKYKEYNPNLESIGSSIVGYPELMKVYYNTIDFYSYLHDELMPSVETSGTSATEQASMLTTANLSPVAVTNVSTCSASTATSAVLALAKSLVYSDYQVKISDGQLSGTAWSGIFTVTNYSDEEDTYTTGRVNATITGDQETYIRQQVEKSLGNKSGIAHDVKELFALSLSDFRIQIKTYCLVSLSSYADACQSCLDILIQHGVADENHFLYDEIYLNYYDKLMALQTEIQLRESEIAIIIGKYDKHNELIEDGIQTAISHKNEEIQDALNFENYIGEDLWKEFCAYRREDTYKNENYISDGLDNRALIENALQFIEVAKKEIVKSSTMQHSIKASLQNLLVMKEFQSIVQYFNVGNWIHVMIDGEVYRLRLIYYEVHYDKLESIDIEFSDVKKTATGLTDSESILNQAASMASSYDSIKRQAGNGDNTRKVLTGWVTDGLALTKMKIIDNADSQNIVWDEHGILCREYLPITDDYSDKQLKIINRGLYLTNDNWRTSKAGIGNFVFYDPSDGEEKESYGVIADTLVGNLILAENVGIYNKNNSITMDEQGLVIITNNGNPILGKKALQIKKRVLDENDNETFENVFYVDNDGNVHMSGILDAAEGHFTGEVTATSLTICGESQDKPIDEYIQEVITDPLSALQDNIDGKTTTWYGATEPEDAEPNDIWYDTTHGKIYRKSSSGTWVDITNEALKAALDKAGDAQAIADSKIKTFSQNDAPVEGNGVVLDIGDLWFDTNDGNKLYRWNGLTWVDVHSAHLDYLIDLTDGKTTTYYSSTEPEDAVENDIWYDTTSHKIKIKLADGDWEDITDEALKKALDLAGDAKAIADSKIKTFSQTEPPSEDDGDSIDEGDLWIDTNDGNKMYRWSGTQWIDVHYAHLDYLVDKVDGKTTTFYSSTEPDDAEENDIWYDTTAHKIKRKLANGSWDDITSEALKSALDKANTAQATADGKIITFAQTTAPTATAVGDLWIDTDDNNKLYRWSGTAWVAYSDTHLDYLIDVVDGKTTTFYSTSEPQNAEVNDIWYDTDDHVIKRKTSTGWVDITDEALYAALSAAGTAQATADGKVRTFAQTSAPTGMTATDVGDLWIDTDDNNKLYRWSGTAWVDAHDLSVDNLKIGGRNLLLKSNYSTENFYEFSENSISGYGFACEGIKYGSYQMFGQIGQLSLKPNTDYILSFTAWIDSSSSSARQAMNIDLYPDTLPEIIFGWENGITPTPTRYQWIINSSQSDMRSCSLRFFNDQATTYNNQQCYQRYTIYITDIQLEKGNHATDWKPAPEDIEEQVSTVYTFANNIFNGTNGIAFSNSSVGSVTINNQVGVKVVGTNSSYFQVKNNAMGFFDSSNNGLMYYEDGNMILKGWIYAQSGYIGGQNGWQIATNCMYNGGASTLGSAGGIYLGTSGISIGSAIQMQPSGTLLLVRSDNDSGSDGYAMKIVEDANYDESGMNYTLYMGGNLQFDSSFVLPMENGGTGGADRDSAGANLGLLRANSTTNLENVNSSGVNTYGSNGDICVIYSNGNNGAEISGMVTQNSDYYVAIGTASVRDHAGHRQTDSYFGYTNCYWNISGLSSDSVSTEYCRVGVGATKSGAGGFIIPLDITLRNLTSVDTVTLQFTANLKPAGAVKDYVSKISNAVTIALCKYDKTTLSGSVIGTTQFTMPSAWQSAVNADRQCSATIYCQQPVTDGDNYCVIFWSRTGHTMMWIRWASVSIPSVSIGAASGLYLKTGGLWKPLMEISQS